MSLTKISVKGSALLCSELDANFDYVLDLANSTGELDCSKINTASLSTCLSANPVITQIQTDIGDNATAIGEVSQDLTDAQTTLQGNINNLITLIGNQNTTIADLTNQISSLTAAFNALDGTVAAFNSRLLSVEGRLLSLEEALASGLIVIWSGLVSAIPTGWQLANGTNGTPDLRDRFIVGAGSAYAVNSIGGSVNHSHTLTGNTGSTVLTTDQIPSHNHSVTIPKHTHRARFPANYFGSPQISGRFSFSGDSGPLGGYIDNPLSEFGGETIIAGTDLNPSCANTGGNNGHTHTISGNTSINGNLPPYYALAYIMKI